MTNQRCETCRFWRGFHEDQGECRRRAPLPLSVRAYARGLDDDETVLRFPEWPTTTADDWCGEWETVVFPDFPVSQASDEPSKKE